jgi:hypothetical protein
MDCVKSGQWKGPVMKGRGSMDPPSVAKSDSRSPHTQNSEPKPVSMPGVSLASKMRLW